MADAKENKIKKRFGFSDLLLSAIGSTIGAGVFVLLPIGISMAGLGIIISLLLASLVTILVAFNYGELAAAMPMDGGGYTWIARAFGKESSSFIIGWLVWLGNMGYAALSALGFSLYAGAMFNMLNPIPLALGALLFFMIINILTMKISIRIEKLMTLTIFAIFVIFWLSLGSDMNLSNFQYASYQMEFIPIFTAASLLYVLFVGFEAVSTVSAEAKNSLDLPKVFIYCVLIVTAIYVVTALFLIGRIYPMVGEKETLLLNISDSLTPLIVLAASFATLTSLNAGLIAASRNAYALARDDMIPRVFRRISRDFGTPVFSVIVSGIITALFIFSGAVEYVASIADFGYLICISMVCASVIFLRITEPKMKRPYKVPLYPLTSIFGIILPIFLLMFLDESAVNTGLLWILIGFFVYNLYRIVKSETRKKNTKFNELLRKFL